MAGRLPVTRGYVIWSWLEIVCKSQRYLHHHYYKHSIKKEDLPPNQGICSFVRVWTPPPPHTHIGICSFVACLGKFQSFLWWTRRDGKLIAINWLNLSKDVSVSESEDRPFFCSFLKCVNVKWKQFYLLALTYNFNQWLYDC